jgi:hypothetical protein
VEVYNAAEPVSQEAVFLMSDNFYPLLGLIGLIFVFQDKSIKLLGP